MPQELEKQELEVVRFMIDVNLSQEYDASYRSSIFACAKNSFMFNKILQYKYYLLKIVTLTLTSTFS